MNGWAIDRVEFYAGHYHVRFRYFIPFSKEDELDPPPPPVWSIEEIWPTDDTGAGIGSPIKVVTLNSIGLLDNRTLHKIIDPTLNLVDEWDTDMDWEEVKTKMKNLDTGFYETSIKTWMWFGNEYGRADINYIGIGYGMAHLGFPFEYGVWGVRMWKLNKSSLEYLYIGWPTDNTWFWWTKGYDMYLSKYGPKWTGP
ncbi:MAG: hypothetical protein WBC05_15040 [Sedimentisphaerales bacterium]